MAMTKVVVELADQDVGQAQDQPNAEFQDRARVVAGQQEAADRVELVNY